MVGGATSVLDPAPDSKHGITHSGAGISVASNGVVIQGFTIRDGADKAIYVNADGVVVRAMRIVGSLNGVATSNHGGIQILANQFHQIGIDAVDAFGSDDLIVKGNTFEDCSFCVNLSGDRIAIVGNHFDHCESECLDVVGAAPLVQLNTVRRAGLGLSVRGDSARVIGNAVALTGNEGIYVLGDGATVTGNALGHVEGFTVTGATPLVSRNRVTDAFLGVGVGGAGAVVTYNAIDDANLDVEGDGVRVEHNTVNGGRFTGTLSVNCFPCTSTSVAYNVVTDSFNNAVMLDSDAPGMIVQANTVSTSRLAAYYVAGTGILLKNNHARNAVGALQDADSCFMIVGSGNTLEANVAESCAAHGFGVGTDSNTLTGNVASNSLLDGFRILAGTGNVLTGNRSSGSLGAGFSLSSSSMNTSLVSNTSSASDRTSLCDEGVATQLAGNVFPTTSAMCDIVR